MAPRRRTRPRVPTSCARCAPPPFTALIAFGLFLPLIAFQAGPRHPQRAGARDALAAVRRVCRHRLRRPADLGAAAARAHQARLAEFCRAPLRSGGGRRLLVGREHLADRRAGRASASRARSRCPRLSLRFRHARLRYRRRLRRGQRSDTRRRPIPAATAEPDRRRPAHGRARLPARLSADDVLAARARKARSNGSTISASRS